MSEKLLYYLGAGASAQALPIVKDSDDGKTQGLASSFRIVAHNVRNVDSDNEQQEYLNKIAENLEWLANKSDAFGTIDTYAKHLYLMNDDKLADLKYTLSTYFSLEQLWHKKRDKRYLIWLTSILDRSIFPENIKIFTWNYDFQMELSAETFQKENLNHSNRVSVHSPPLIKYYPQIGNSFSYSSDGYEPKDISLLHLNGIAGFYAKNQGYRNENLFLNYNDDDKMDIFSKIIKDSHLKHHLLTFAWETSTNAAQSLEGRIQFAEYIASETTILIIIGYSFPFFNRKIDKKIFDVLKASGKLKKIYFQDPVLDGSFLKSQFDLNVEIVHIKRLDSFFIPFEL